MPFLLFPKLSELKLFQDRLTLVQISCTIKGLPVHSMKDGRANLRSAISSLSLFHLHLFHLQYLWILFKIGKIKDKFILPGCTVWFEIVSVQWTYRSCPLIGLCWSLSRPISLMTTIKYQQLIVQVKFALLYQQIFMIFPSNGSNWTRIY